MHLLRTLAFLSPLTTCLLNVTPHYLPPHGAPARWGAMLGRGRPGAPNTSFSSSSSYTRAICTKVKTTTTACPPGSWTPLCTSVMPTASRWSTCQVTVASSQKRMLRTVAGRKGATCSRFRCTTQGRRREPHKLAIPRFQIMYILIGLGYVIVVVLE